jgi:U3 small nucleolar RNA-associated protein 13
MEGSEDKLWALDCSPDGQLVVTGSADSVLTIWKDVTDQKVVESLNRRKENLENDQKLSNVVRNGDWAQAIRLAI